MGLLSFRKTALVLAGGAMCLALAACETTSQTTSGRDYLDRYAQKAREQRQYGGQGLAIDSQIRDAAAVEPLLHFPARIGIARIAPPGLSGGPALGGIPENEAKAWSEAAARLGPGFAEFVPISPLVAEMFAPRSDNPFGRESTRETIEKIRLGAARQHVDAVIIYESAGTADSQSNPLSIAEWTLIGAFILPSQSVKAQGVAQAILLDVRNGYPYGIVQTAADDATLTARFSTHETERDLGEAARLSAVNKLPAEVEQLMRKLRAELDAKRAHRSAER